MFAFCDRIPKHAETSALGAGSVPRHRDHQANVQVRSRVMCILRGRPLSQLTLALPSIPPAPTPSKPCFPPSPFLLSHPFLLPHQPSHLLFFPFLPLYLAQINPSDQSVWSDRFFPFIYRFHRIPFSICLTISHLFSIRSSHPHISVLAFLC